MKFEIRKGGGTWESEIFGISNDPTTETADCNCSCYVEWFFAKAGLPFLVHLQARVAGNEQKKRIAGCVLR